MGRRLIVAALLLAACASRIPPPLPHARGYVAGHPPEIAYVVREGDTLYAIGRRFGVPWRAIARRNRIEPPYRLVVGQRLVIDLRARRGTKPAKAHAKARASVSAGAQARIAVPSRARTPASAIRRERPPRRHATHARRKPRARTARRTHAPEIRAGHAPAARVPVRFIWPVKGVITSRFGRRHGRWHDGVDIAAPRGTPVHAAADGVVIYADRRLTGYGNLVIIRHAHELFTAYAHNERMLVKQGERVRRGQVIATVGATGRATGPHLHFEIRIGARPVDPLAYLPPR